MKRISNYLFGQCSLMINSANEKKYIKFVGPCDLLKMKTLLQIPPGWSDFHFLQFSKMDKSPGP